MSEIFGAIGVDLGGTKIAFGLVDNLGKIIKRVQLRTDINGGSKAIEEQIISVVKSLREESEIPLVGLGVGIAGQVESQTGIVKFAPNLVWNYVPLQDDLRKALEMPVIVVNDVRAATWGEWIYGAGKGCQDLICIFIGTGIGGCMISGGKILTGANNTCGEIGHMVIDFHGPQCTCGNRGCWEATAGGWAIAKRAQDAIRNYGDAGSTMLRLAAGKVEDVSSKIVSQAASLSDPLAELIMEQTKLALVAGCVGLVNAFNPGRLIFGGGFIEGNPNIIPYIEDGIKMKALKTASSNLELAQSSLHSDAGVIGAAALAIKTFTDEENKK